MRSGPLVVGPAIAVLGESSAPPDSGCLRRAIGSAYGRNRAPDGAGWAPAPARGWRLFRLTLVGKEEWR